MSPFGARVILAVWLAATLAAGQTGAASEPLRLEISAPKAVFDYGEQITWAVTVKNISAAPVRIMKPDFSYRTSDSVAAFVIERADGSVAERYVHCMETVMISPADFVSAVLDAGKVYGASLKLFGDILMQDAAGAPVANLPSLSCWTYRFGKESDQHLKPGQYRVTLRYWVPSTGQPYRWSDRLSAQFGDPWRGLVKSNTVAITIK